MLRDLPKTGNSCKNNSDKKDTDFPVKCGVFNGHILKGWQDLSICEADTSGVVGGRLMLTHPSYFPPPSLLKHLLLIK